MNNQLAGIIFLSLLIVAFAVAGFYFPNKERKAKGRGICFVVIKTIGYRFENEMTEILGVFLSESKAMNYRARFKDEDHPNYPVHYYIEEVSYEPV